MSNVNLKHHFKSTDLLLKIRSKTFMNPKMVTRDNLKARKDWKLPPIPTRLGKETDLFSEY